MSGYPPRVAKSEAIYELWKTGEGDMGELAIGLYDLTAHYKALWDDFDLLLEVAKAAKKYRQCHWTTENRRNIDNAFRNLSNDTRRLIDE